MAKSLSLSKEFSNSAKEKTSLNGTVCKLPFSPTNGKDQVKTSIKFGNQYGWGEQLNCRIFITLFSYFKIAAETRENHFYSISINIKSPTVLPFLGTQINFLSTSRNVCSYSYHDWFFLYHYNVKTVL